ncbi:hypothetical protein AGMMS50239_23060 [Bacteroidia bacterium]|nr:hypothetical protein FACS1894207_3700 [Bacteroidia bacterium]GHT64754.1 hypothetical protein AGMMS50239_23060 [Bacteroidia bacterium]
MKKNNRIKIVICIISLWISIFSISAQPPVIKAVMDSTHILIGHQTQIHLEVAANKNQPLQIPVITDTLINGVEVLAISKIDTTDLGNDRVQLKYHYLITSFDSALYLLPPFKAVVGTDTAYSESLALNVSTFPVDTVSKQFYDIKGVIQPKFVWADFLPWIIGIIWGLGLIALIAFIIYRLVNNKPIIPFKKEKPYIPPHTRAIQELDAVKIQKLWQMGKVKEYHSDITDILRKYIDEQFDIPALEMTSGEILDKVKGYSDIDSSYDNLKQILILADFVKFAKYNPLPDENELSLMNAYLFVNHTKKEELPAEETEKEGSSQ